MDGTVCINLENEVKALPAFLTQEPNMPDALADKTDSNGHRYVTRLHQAKQQDPPIATTFVATEPVRR